MIIAVHLSPSSHPTALWEAFSFLAKKKTSLHIIFFTESNQTNTPKIDLPNIQYIPIKPLQSNLRLQYWYQFQLPSLLKKHQVEVFVSEAGLCSLKTKIPQYLWLNNTGFLQHKPLIKLKHDGYRRRHFPKFVKKSNAVLLSYAYMIGQLTKQYQQNEEKLHFIGSYFTSPFIPIEWKDKESILNNLSNGNEYFFCECNSYTKANITTILKAFSLFKKRMKSGIKLLLLLNDVTLDECVKDFRLYKYREDVTIKQITDKDYSLATLLAAAYAVIHLPKEITGKAETGLQAMLTGVPVIGFQSAEHLSLYGDAALLTTINEQSIAEKLMLLYKDELLRTKLIQKGLELSAEYQLPQMANRLCQTIFTTMPKKEQ